LRVSSPFGGLLFAAHYRLGNRKFYLGIAICDLVAPHRTIFAAPRHAQTHLYTIVQWIHSLTSD